MKPINMDGVQGYSDFETLPLGSGGYVVKILGVAVKTNSVGEYLELSCDVAEGEYKDFFLRNYQAQTGENRKWRCAKFINLPKDDGSVQDGWAKRALKTLMDALEESNPGYHWDWDESKLKGKLVGGLFREEEYLGSNDNNLHIAVRLGGFTTVEKIRKGDFRPLQKKLLKGDASEPSGIASVAGFTHVENYPDLPF